MKTLTILINKPELNITYISENTCKYVHDYIDYKLQPYIKLGLFSYSIHRNTKSAIDGSDYPMHLLEVLRKYTISAQNNTEILFSFECLDFFYIHTQQCYLLSNEYDKVNKTPEHYCLFYTDIYP